MRKDKGKQFTKRQPLQSGVSFRGFVPVEIVRFRKRLYRCFTAQIGVHLDELKKDIPVND